MTAASLRVRGVHEENLDKSFERLAEQLYFSLPISMSSDTG